MPDATPTKPVLRPQGGLAAVLGVAAAVFVVATVVAALGLADGASIGRVLAVVACALVALVCLLGFATAATTRVRVEGQQVHVTSMLRTTTRSLAAPATVRFHYSRPTRNNLSPPWRLTLSEPGMADLSIGTYQVGPAAPLLRQVAPAVQANPGLPADELTAAALRDPENPPPPG